ncbi:MAG TPA: glycoside hydrolase family 97 catalytic domain-containing protein [Clostridia bacterium]|nr:glycoside hydrolase family 97 catalytic domain-containing protein [Clostridia bacterium]
MLRSAFILLIAAVALPGHAAVTELSSPDRAVQLLLSTDSEGHLTYSVRWNGQPRLETARAGVVVDNSDLGASIKFGTPTTRRIAESFPWRGNKTNALGVCQATELPMRSEKAGIDWILEARVFDDGVGFRYRIPGNGKRHVKGESTAWQLPRNSTVWFQTDTANYEGEYHSSRADQIPVEKTIENKKYPVHLGLPATVVFNDGTFGMLSEAALFRYSGLTLRPEGDAKFRAAFEDDPNGWSHGGTIVSPWRVIILSKDLNGLVNSDLIAALCEPPDPQLFPKGMNTDWIRPGKAPCTWMVYGNDGAQWDRQKWFVDVSAATGCEYLLVDAGWRSEKWGWLKDGGDLWARAAELCRYAAERNVGIVLWHAYPEGRDDGPGLTTVEAREELFRNCAKAGVKGIKIDFFDSESKAVIDAYEDLARRAAKYQLMINFHGANKPTGEVRTWPNEVTREGIREQEYVLWGELPLEHYGALPFTRMAVGHADFLPGYIQPRFLKNTTVIFQMASTLVFSSPFLCWPDNPESYLNTPLLQFVRTVPVTWDETRILPGSAIGETVIMARRKGTEWYLAVLNCKPEARNLTVDLSFADLAGKELTLYRDGSEKGSSAIQTAVKPPTNGKLSVDLKAGGGFIAHLAAPKQFAGWK